MKRCINLASLFTVFFISSVLAVTTTWDGSGSWTTSGNWDNGVPAAGDTVSVNSGQINFDSATPAFNNFLWGSNSNPVIDINSDVTFTNDGLSSYLYNVTINQNSGTVSISGNKATSGAVSGKTSVYNINGGSLDVSCAGGLRFGDGGGIFTINIAEGASFVAPLGASLGHGAASSGVINQHGGTVDVSASTIYLGKDGIGNYTLNDGYADAQYVLLGYGAAASGELTVNGGTFNLVNDMSVGYDGVGQITINGGTFQTNVNRDYNVGRNAGSTGTITVNGGTLDIVGRLLIGGTDITNSDNGGDGTLIVRSGTVNVDVNLVVCGNKDTYTGGSGKIIIYGSNGRINVGNYLDMRRKNDASIEIHLDGGGISPMVVQERVMVAGSGEDAVELYVDVMNGFSAQVGDRFPFIYGYDPTYFTASQLMLVNQNSIYTFTSYEEDILDEIQAVIGKEYGLEVTEVNADDCQDFKDAGLMMAGDFDGNCVVDMEDFEVIAENWLESLI